jgi:predicted ester cyclase
LAADVAFHGPAPFGVLATRDAVAEGWFWPLARAFPTAHRQAYLFLAGHWQGETWVAATGDLVGVQSAPLARVPQGADLRRLRFGEFYRIEEGRIAEMRCLLDIPGLAAQAGYRILPPFAGREGPPPGPALGQGLQLAPQDPVAGAYTLRLIEDMLGGCNRLDGSNLASMGMAAYWHEDMVWHGPWGVGSCYGFRDFQDHAQGPSVRSFPNRRGGFHEARIAEGLAGCFTGWPSLRGTFNGAPFRGIPPTGGEIGQNIMDFYIRRGDRLHENWVLIDLVDFAAQCGVDLLARLPM